MADETLNESVDTSTTEATTVEAADMTAEPTSAETKNTEQASENMVPSFRLKEEADKRREAESELERLKAEIAAKSEDVPANEPNSKVSDMPPDDIRDERERVRWMIQNDAREFMEETLGMTLDQAKTILSSSSAASKDLAQRKWIESCQKHSLDPESTEVQTLVSGMVKGANSSLDDALALAAKVYGKPNGTTESPAATVAETNVAPVMTTEGRIPRSVKEAVEMAAKGQRAPQLSSTDIIKAKLERAGKT